MLVPTCAAVLTISRIVVYKAHTSLTGGGMAETREGERECERARDREGSEKLRIEIEG